MKIRTFLFMALLHFVAMYVLMYSMVNSVLHIYPNINQLYMAGLMTAPMLFLEGLMMGPVYENKQILHFVIGASILALGLFFVLIRQQIAVTDREFLRSMIPHHSSAILMCQRAKIIDQEIKDLCLQIVQSQEEEINEMERINERLN